MNQHVFLLQAEIIEVKEKPSVPLGSLGVNAFGEHPKFKDKGIRRRAIVALGEQDVCSSGLSPVEAGISILGASSDHLILDITEYKEVLKVGNIVSFYMNYKALLHLMTSPYVKKVKISY